jgi:organic hydroperoxide reductase OsmC/OhrA
MQPFPHHYAVAASAAEHGGITLESRHLPALETAAPAEFGGPGDRWSPETLLVAAVADCFVLTFRAAAEFSRLPWQRIGCEVQGVVNREARVTRFTDFYVRVRLRVPEGANVDEAGRLLARAEQACLVARSLNAAFHFDPSVEVVGTKAA